MLKSDRDLLNRVVETDPLRQKRFFITGGTGFFGLNFLEALSELNQKSRLDLEVTLLVRDEVRARKLLADSGISIPKTRFLVADLMSFLGKSFEHPAYDCIYHFAASTDLNVLKAEPERERSAIIDGTRNIMELARRCGSGKVIYLSSGAVYGKQPQDILKLEESHSASFTAPESDVYGSSKVIAEKECLRLGKEYGVDAVILRGFAFGGPHLRLDAHYAIGNLLTAAMSGNPIVVREGSTVRSYLNIIDSMIWILKATFSQQKQKIFNLGSDQAVTMEELAQKISQVSGNPNVQVLNRSDTPNRYVPNVDLAKKEWGVEVYTLLEQIIRNMIEWNRK